MRILFLIITLVSFPVLSSWSEVKTPYIPFHQDGYVLTAKSICKKAETYREISKSYKKIKIKDSIFTKRSFKIISLMQEKRSDLVFINPGLFTDSDHSTVRELTKLFFDKGYHIIVFPSPVVKSFSKSKSNFPIISPEFESLLYYRTIKKYISQNIELINNVNLLGISYGSFLSSIINSMNVEDNSVIYEFEKVIALSPPSNLKNAFDIIDQNLMSSTIKLNLKGYFDLFKLQKSLCVENPDMDYIDENIDLIREIVSIVGFEKSLKESVQSYVKYQKNISFKKFKDEITFNNYFLKYNKEMLNWLDSERSNILYWIKRANGFNKNKVSILTSDNGFFE